MCFYDFILLNHDIQITGKKLRTHGTDLRTSLEEKPDPSAEKTEPGSRKIGSPVETKHVFYILIVTEVKLLFVLLWFYSIKSQRSNHGKKVANSLCRYQNHPGGKFGPAC